MGKVITEQQRIAAALESMVDTNDGEGKKNVTEQQRIASALEAIAESGGGGGSGSGNVMIVNAIQEETSVTVDKSFLEVLNHVKNGGFVVLHYRYADSNDSTYCYYLSDAGGSPANQITFEWYQWMLMYTSLTVYKRSITLSPKSTTDGATIENTVANFREESYPLVMQS